MSIVLPVLQTVYTTGSTIYAILHDSLTGNVWNTNTSAWESWNEAHWANYAISLTEQTDSGYYIAARPAGVAGYLTTETIYLQAGASPASTDSPPFFLGHSAGVNIASISGDAATAPTNLESVLASQITGRVATGVITSSSFTTNLTNATAGAYQGRVIYFTTGACAGMAGLIANYAPTGGVITLSGSLAANPSANDYFVIA